MQKLRTVLLTTLISAGCMSDDVESLDEADGFETTEASLAGGSGVGFVGKLANQNASDGAHFYYLGAVNDVYGAHPEIVPYFHARSFQILASDESSYRLLRLAGTNSCIGGAMQPTTSGRTYWVACNPAANSQKWSLAGDKIRGKGGGCMSGLRVENCAHSIVSWIWSR